MNKAQLHSAGRDPRAAQPKLSRDTVYLIGDLLPLCDFTGVLLAAYLGTLAYVGWIGPGITPAAIWDAGGRAALAAAVLAPLILCDRAFVSFASGRQTAALIRCYVVRFLMFAGVVGLVGLSHRSLEILPPSWLAAWLVSTLAITAITRLLLVGTLRRLERKGVLTETVAVVGAGAVADRLIDHLRATRGDSVEIVGVYDDRVGRSADCAHPADGSLAELVAVGQARPLDWILLTLPDSAQSRVQSMVLRLKTLAVPIGLCPQNVGLAAFPEVRPLGDHLSVTLLAARPANRWDAALATAEIVVPRWIMTLLGLPVTVLRMLARSLRGTPAARLAVALDDYDLDGFTRVAAGFGHKRFGYVVTPNADHLLRLQREPSFRKTYADAAFVLLDSRFIAHLLRFTRKLRLPVCTGSDLTAKLFGEVIRPDDPLVLIGCDDAQAAKLAARYGLTRLAHFNPPMGFINDPAAVEACLRFVEAHSPFRYCLLAVGAPQQEAVAQQLKERRVAKGLALCVGASINFLTGEEQRAPQWMQRSGLEWLFRLLQAPARMAERYLVRGPQIFALLQRTDILLRRTLLVQPERRPAIIAAPRRRAATKARVRASASA